MKNKNSFLVAIAFVCVIAFSVCLSSCSDKDDNNDQEQLSVVVGIDVTEGSFELRPLINWNATADDVDKHVGKYYSSDCLANYGGEIIYDTILKSYVKVFTITDSLYSYFYFNDVQGQDYCANQFYYYGSNDVEHLKDKLLRQGFSFMGYVDTEVDGYGFNWCYSSRDKKTLAQITTWDGYNSWSLAFSPYIEEDLNYMSRIDIYNR